MYFYFLGKEGLIEGVHLELCYERFDDVCPGEKKEIPVKENNKTNVLKLGNSRITMCLIDNVEAVTLGGS